MCKVNAGVNDMVCQDSRVYCDDLGGLRTHSLMQIEPTSELINAESFTLYCYNSEKAARALVIAPRLFRKTTIDRAELPEDRSPGFALAE